MPSNNEPADLSSACGLAAPIRIVLACVAHAVCSTSIEVEAVRGTEADWERALNLSVLHGVSSLMFEAIRGSPTILDICPRETGARFAAASMTARLSADVQLGELSDAKKALDEAGIGFLTIKGRTLGALAYASHRLRPSGDIDLLVRKNQFMAAVDEFIGMGYTPVRPDAISGHVLLGRKEIEKYAETKTGVTLVSRRATIDLHWTLDDFENPHLRPWFPFNSGLATLGMFETATRVSLGGEEVSTLAPDELLGYLCFHGAKHGWARLIWAADIAGLIHRSNLSWERVAQLAERSGTKRIVRIGLILAVDLLGAILHGDMDRQIRRDRLAVRAAHVASQGMLHGISATQLHGFRMLAFEGVRPKVTYVGQLLKKRLVR